MSGVKTGIDTWNVDRFSKIPEKSQECYKNAYMTFKNWIRKKATNINEKSLLAYFVTRNKTLKPPASLWAHYFMLKTTIFRNDSIDISKFPTLIAYLKKRDMEARQRTASVFSREQFTKFLLQAPDEKFLAHKVGLIIGVAGACKRDELYNMKVKDIKEHNESLIIRIHHRNPLVDRSFVVNNNPNGKVNYLDIYHKYINLRPNNAKPNLFLNYHTNQPISLTLIGSWASDIAEYLKLKNPATYTMHSFRLGSAILLSNEDERLEGCTSSTIVADKVGVFVKNKIQFPQKILHGDKNGELSKPSTSKFNKEDKENPTREIIDNADVSIVWADGPSCSTESEPTPSVFIKSELDEVPESHGNDHDYSCEMNPLDIKSELEVEESEIQYSTEFGNPTPENHQRLLKEIEYLRKEVHRLNSLVEEQKQELVVSKQNEMRLEQIVQSVKEIVNQ